MPGAEPPLDAAALRPRAPPTAAELAPLDNAGLAPEHMRAFIVAAVEDQGLVSHNLESYNDLVETGIAGIMENSFAVDRAIPNERALTEEDRACTGFLIRLRFSSVELQPPRAAAYMTGTFTKLLPEFARTSGHPYAGEVTLEAHISVTASFADGRTNTREAHIPRLSVGKFPIMVRSARCHTALMTRAALRAAGEGPDPHGGYFVAKRNEYVVDLLENIRYNSPHYHRAMKPNELVRCEFLSQPGGPYENSSQVRIRLLTNGQLTVELTSVKFQAVQLPFFLVYRLLGELNDERIAESIVWDLWEEDGPDPVAEEMRRILATAFHTVDPRYAELVPQQDPGVILRKVSEKISTLLTDRARYATNEDAVAYLCTNVLDSLDRVFFPHIGLTPASRGEKLRYLGLLIRGALLVHLGVALPTDRDNYRNKRVHGAGVSLAKAFKTHVNTSVVSPIVSAVVRELRNNPWAAVSAASLTTSAQNSLRTTDLYRALEQVLTGGSKTITVRQRTTTNRVASSALERKNPLYTLCAQRSIVTSNSGNAAKQTERADRLRRVHPSYLGYICVSQSADTGENVGMRKQLALGASVCGPTDAGPLRRWLASDPAVRRGLPPRELAAGDQVFLNGEWVGTCVAAAADAADPAAAAAPGLALARRYRALRRAGRVVEATATIAWDPATGAVEFWTDAGRLRRPLLIVDNNIDEYDAARRAGAPVPFVQRTQFTPAIAADLAAARRTIHDLVRDGVAEWITPEEHENCYIAPGIAALVAAAADPTRQYTHVEVPEALLGLAAHLSPYGNHTQPARVTYETNQGRQAGGWYADNYAWRADKNRFHQLYIERPLVDTIIGPWVPPSGAHVRMAMLSAGDNQEDSVVFSQSAADAGLFSGIFFRAEIVELEKNLAFATPDPAKTRGVYKPACYEKLVDGVVRAGVTVVRDDVLVGRVEKLKAPEDGYEYVDRSVTYRGNEPAFVESAACMRGGNDEPFVVVRLRYERPLRTGDKLSNRSGNKSIVARMVPRSEMPYDDDGVPVDILISPHSLPTRMTIGQMFETAAAEVCARRGVTADGTAFAPVDAREFGRLLESLGLRFSGRTRLYDGATGRHYDAAVFAGMLFVQRLQKFVFDDEQYVGSSGPTDATTGQPLAGKQAGGGMRIGEMEVWTLASHGAMETLAEKLSTHSDGRSAYVCRGCGQPAAYNPARAVYDCRVCRENARITEVDSCKASMLFQEELRASGIAMKLGLRPPTFYADQSP
jgi:DNA-directed RNA polymerase subunit B